MIILVNCLKMTVLCRCCLYANLCNILLYVPSYFLCTQEIISLFLSTKSK